MRKQEYNLLDRPSFPRAQKNLLWPTLQFKNVKGPLQTGYRRNMEAQPRPPDHTGRKA